MSKDEITRSVLDIAGKQTKIIQEKSKRQEREARDSLKAMDFAMSLGYSIVFPLVGGVIIGVVLDRKFQSSPTFTLSLLFFGLFVGVYSAFRLVRDEFSK